MANEENAVLIVGATGTVGQEAVRATAARGGKIRALVRSVESAGRLPSGVEPVSGDLRDERAVTRALAGVRAAFYVSPHEPDEVELAERFVRACETARVRLVFVGVHVDGPWGLSRAFRRFMYGRLAPHYRAKFRISERVRTSRTDAVVLMPTNFYQNDEIFRESILGGSFPTAFEGVNRVDVRDLGAAIARGLLEPSFPAGAYPVFGPKSLTGDECAAIWSAALGCDVRCERDPRSVEAALSPSIQGKKRDDFLKTYRVLRGFQLPTKSADVARTRELIGYAPTPYESYVRDTLAHWREAPPPQRAVHQAYASGASPVGGKI